MATIKNLDRLIKKLDNIKAGTQKRVEQVLDDAARQMYNTAVQEIGKVSPGRQYIINGKPHTASRPGDYPNVLSGTLRNSLFWDLQKGKLTARFGVKGFIDYARALEFGYPARNLEPRPFIQPSYNKHYKEVPKEIDRIIKEVLNANKI